MNRTRLLLAGLRHYWRTHLGTVAGMAVATATLVGALAVGDSVQHSLRERAEARVGAVTTALSSGDRFFLDTLGARLEEQAEGEVTTAPVVLLLGVASSSDGSARVHDVGVHGVTERFFGLRPDRGEMSGPRVPEDGGAFVNRTLAERLGLGVGDQLVVRVARPSALPRDVALAQDDITVALRVSIERVLSPREFGEFGLLGGSLPTPNLFLPLAWLQERVEVEGRANLLLATGLGPDAADEALGEAWTPPDAQLELRALDEPAAGRWELRTSRVFFDAPVLDALRRAEGLDASELRGVFTYFVNSIRSGERATPYSMVSGLGPLEPAEGPTAVMDTTLDDEGIVLNRWEADDLGAAVGDPITLEYTVIDASRRLAEREHTFTVRGIVPLEGAAADPALMPDFPGLADAENCRDWEPGTPVELDRIRDEDEEYWDEHGGTPKAFLTLGAARELWTSRFGELTAVRFGSELEPAVRAALAERLEPASLGLYFSDVAARAETAGQSSTDFGGLFVGLSSFLIAAALLLAGQLFAFGVQQRSREAGVLSAVGFEARTVRGLFLVEALVLALVGALVGLALGLLYTRLVLRGLSTVWSEAVASAAVAFHVTPATLVVGAAAAIAASLGTAWLVVRRELRSPSQALLTSSAGVVEPGGATRGRGWQVAVALACAVGALALVVLVDPSSGPSAAGAFFGAGALALAGALLACRLWLRGAAARHRAPVRSLSALGVAGTWRRPGRSLALVALAALGTFLVAAVGANRLGPVADETARDSGTGGFLFYGRTSLPIVHELDSPEGRDAYLLNEEVMQGVSIVPLRVRAGDDASCLNLARPSAPRLLGVDPAALIARDAFRFAATIEEAEDPWSLLDLELGEGVVPGIGDATSLTWQLKKGLGDTLDYVDERGRPFQVRIVATLADTILQGDLLVASDRFQDLFPTEGGHRAVLVDAPPARADEVEAALTRGLQDLGLALERTGARLAAFHAVQNTYLSVFQLLGGLGLLLGSVGLGVVLLRNTFERRAELALASALGFRPRRVRWWIVAEYGTLLALGLGVGLGAALVAVLPAMQAPASDLSPGGLFLLGGVVGLAGLVWISLAARIAVQRAPLSVLGAE